MTNCPNYIIVFDSKIKEKHFIDTTKNKSHAVEIVYTLTCHFRIQGKFIIYYGISRTGYGYSNLPNHTP